MMGLRISEMMTMMTMMICNLMPFVPQYRNVCDGCSNFQGMFFVLQFDAVRFSISQRMR